MATTQVYANGDGTTIDFSFSFPYLKTEDIKVELQEINPNGRFISSVVVTDFTVPTNNPTQIQFNTLSASTNYQTVLGAPLANHAVNQANTIRVKIYRETNDNAVPSTFFSGSAVRAQDLNNNFDQNLYLYQELENEAVKADGGVVTGNITFDQVVTINKVPSEDTDAVNVAYLEQFVGGDSATVNTTRYREIAIQGQTTVTVSPTFAVGNEFVFINGVGLSKFIEYSTPNGSTVVFTTALRAGDVIDVISYNNLLVVSGDPSFDEPPFSRNAFIATAGQTVFVCTEEYTIGKEQVFLNGALLQRGVDYTAINKVNVTLTVAALVDDLVEVHSGNYFASGISSAVNSAYTYPGGVEQTVQARLEQTVSVKDFGAVGDGVTDDTAAFNSAFKLHKSVYVPPGDYKLTDTLVLYHPFDVRGAGMETTRLIWSGLGGLTGKDGISVECRAPYRKATGYISDMSLVTTGFGNRAFGTEKAQAISDPGTSVVNARQPRYIVERLQIRGNTPDTLDNRFTDCWRIGIDIGASREPVVRDCYLMGSFDESNVSNSDSDSICATRAIAIGGGIPGEEGATVSAACVSALVDHCFVYYYGSGLYLGQRLSQGVARACHLNTCWNGIMSPDVNGGNFTYTEFLIHDMQIQAQRYGVRINSGWINCTNVRSSRSGGADTATFPWYGFYLDTAGSCTLQGCRSYYNQDVTETKANYGIWAKDADYLKISDHTIVGGQNMLTEGIRLDDVGRAQSSNVSMTNVVNGFNLLNGSALDADNTKLTNVTNAKVIATAGSKRASTFGTLDSGTYDPTVVLTNIAESPETVAATAAGAMYYRVGDLCTVSFKVRATPAAGSAYSKIYFTLPDFGLGNFGNERQLCGAAVSLNAGSNPNRTAIVRAETGATRGEILWYAPDTVTLAFTVTCTFEILQ